MARNSGGSLNKQDFSAKIARDCREAHAILDELLPLAKSFAFAPIKDRSRIDRLLVRLQVRAGRIRQFAVPLPSVGELHGLPPEACDVGTAPKPAVVHRHKPGWDFRPWLTEKTLRLWQCVERIFAGFEVDAGSAPDFILRGRRPRGKLAPVKELEEIARSLLTAKVEEARYLTKTLDDQLRTGGLTVAEILPPETDD